MTRKTKPSSRYLLATAVVVVLVAVSFWTKSKPRAARVHEHRMANETTTERSSRVNQQFDAADAVVRPPRVARENRWSEDDDTVYKQHPIIASQDKIAQRVKLVREAFGESSPDQSTGMGAFIDRRVTKSGAERITNDFVSATNPVAAEIANNSIRRDLPVSSVAVDISETANNNQTQPTRVAVHYSDLAANSVLATANVAAEIQSDASNVSGDGVRPAALSLPENDGAPSRSTQGTTDYKLAAQPQTGDHYKSETPLIDRQAYEIPAITDDFSPDAIAPDQPYDAFWNQSIYDRKLLNANQRPLLELGRPWYQLGQLSPGSSLLGFHNNVNPQFLIFGDYRQAIASNTVNGDNSTQMAFELNTFWNLFITSTERIVWGIAPLDDGVNNTRWEFDNDRFEFETDFDLDFGYFEGDLGALAGGFIGTTLPFDAPFAVGLTPILIQNGIWFNDAVEGVFFTIPARNSPRFDISNMDITFAYIYDEINSAAFGTDKNAAKAYAIYTFIEALNGYFEIDYAFLEDRTALDRSYHNIGVAYSRRFGQFVSHSTRVIANAGQQVSAGDQTADGTLVLLENSLITSNPYTVIPYFNMFAGFDTPQSVAGDDELLNTGILFESDGMTGFPTLDGRAQDTAGGAIGLNLLAQDFSQQLILEAAAVLKMDDSDLPGDQYGVGMRYQLPLNNSWIFRTDGMYGFFRNDEDDFGARVELRKKF